VGVKVGSRLKALAKSSYALSFFAFKRFEGTPSLYNV